MKNSIIDSYRNETNLIGTIIIIIIIILFENYYY